MDEADWPVATCGTKTVMRTSQTAKNKGRPFFSCSCGAEKNTAFTWVDSWNGWGKPKELKCKADPDAPKYSLLKRENATVGDQTCGLQHLAEISVLDARMNALERKLAEIETYLANLPSANQDDLTWSTVGCVDAPPAQPVFTKREILESMGMDEEEDEIIPDSPTSIAAVQQTPVRFKRQARPVQQQAKRNVLSRGSSVRAPTNSPARMETRTMGMDMRRDLWGNAGT